MNDGDGTGRLAAQRHRCREHLLADGLRAPPVPHTIVMSAGTGGTSATTGRYMRYAGHPTRLLVVDLENSVFHEAHRSATRGLTCSQGSGTDGIGRPRVEKSLVPGVTGEMMQVPDVASVVAIHWLLQRTDPRAGASTGTLLWGVLKVAEHIRAAGQASSLVTLTGDPGERHLDGHCGGAWIRAELDSLDEPMAWLHRSS